jgi:hypothetical protein
MERAASGARLVLFSILSFSFLLETPEAENIALDFEDPMAVSSI